METNPKVIILYRMAEKQNKNDRSKPDYVNNKSCLENLLLKSKKSSAVVDAEVVVFGDRLEKETIDWLSTLPVTYKETTAHGNSETFLEILEFAIENFEAQDIIYFVEDDYIHRDYFIETIVEGLQRSDYVSLYDHPDKYTGQPEILFHTKSSHWKFTHSTTMTFAAKVKTLAFDQRIFENLVTTGNPPDHYIFLELQKLHRKLATCIPARATHGVTDYLAPVVNWALVREDNEYS